MTEYPRFDLTGQVAQFDEYWDEEQADGTQQGVADERTTVDAGLVHAQLERSDRG